MVIAALVIGALSLLPGMFNMKITADAATDKLIYDIVPRITLSAIVIYLMIVYGISDVLKPERGTVGLSLIWSIPCILTALANFPYSALISGSAVIIRTDLIWLVIFKCVSIGLMEELIFRGFVYSILKDRFANVKHRIILSVLLSSLIFAFWHLPNILAGAGVGETFLQVGYSFLIGCMLAAAFERTGNIWICAGIHALFNFGGSIVTDLGSGEFQDTLFWAFTVTAGIISAAHVVITLIKAESNKTNK